MAVKIIEISPSEMDALIDRIESALEDGLSPEPEDFRLILHILRQFALMQERLEGNEVVRQKYLKLMGLISNSETQDKLFSREREKPTPKRKKRQFAAKKPVPVQVCHHRLEGLEKGQLCPKCEQGRLYKFEPASFIRIVGQPPLSANKHVLEQLRCNLCLELFTAPLPPEVSNDGARQQKYGYSARALMAISKFYMGSPYYRQESLQSILGMPVSASTIYDQCALLVDGIVPLFDYLQQLAAQAVHFHMDDTGNRILDQKPVEKANRNGKGTRQRTGVYSSGLIATLAEGQQVVLFQTNIGHAGEWIDEVLASRDPALPAPIVMSDALSSNQPKALECYLSLCNSHARRKFVDIINLFPAEVEYVVQRYARIWKHDTATVEKNLSPELRRDYHQSHSLPVMEEIKSWGEERLDTQNVEENSSLGRAIQYFLKHYEGLTAFCRIPGAKLDNNLQEMVLKLIARGRKNAHFFKTRTGAIVGDVITSLISTCELNGINVFEYLVALQKHRQCVGRHPEKWLPWNYPQKANTVTEVMNG